MSLVSFDAFGKDQCICRKVSKVLSLSATLATIGVSGIRLETKHDQWGCLLGVCEHFYESLLYGWGLFACHF